jgi:hypothetical protein
MPTFETPEPISVTIDLGVAGEVRIAGSDRHDTQVVVRPTDESDDSDVKAAGQVGVEYANGSLMIKGPKAGPFDFSRKTRSVVVSVELPSGSRVSGDVQVGDFLGTGHLGECRFKTGAGHFRLESTGPLRLNTGAGHVTAAKVAGNAEIHTGSGRVVLGQIEGTAEVKNSNGHIEIDAVAGEARLRTSNGDISVERAGTGVDAKTASGSLRLGEVARGAVVLETGMGDLEVGIADGTAAWLEVNTGLGKVHNLLNSTERKPDETETVEVRARTNFGDVTIRRS